MSPKRPVGRPKKLQVVSPKGKQSGDIGSDISITVLRSNVEESEAITNVTPESAENSGKRPRGRPKKLQSSFTRQCDVMKSSDTAVSEIRVTTDDLMEYSPETQACPLLDKLSGTITVVKDSMQIPLIGSPSKAERANSGEALVFDPCRFPQDAEEAYPGGSSSQAQPSAVIEGSEKSPACFTPDPAEKSLKRSRGTALKGSRGKTRKVETTHAELKYGAESAADNTRSKIAGQLETEFCAHDTPSIDKQPEICVMIGSSLEIATSVSGGPMETVQNLSLLRNPLKNEPSAKVEDQIQDACVNSPVPTDEEVMERPDDGSTEAGDRNEAKELEDGRLKQVRGNAGRKPVRRQRKVLLEHNLDNVVSTQETSIELPKKTAKDEQSVPSQRPNLRSKRVGHGKGSEEENEKVGRKRGPPIRGTKPQGPLGGKSKEAVGRRRPADVHSTGAFNRKKGMSAREASGRRYVSEVVLDGVEFRIGEDVYVRKEGSTCPESETEVEECQVCRKADERTMIECDRCLGGFHLTCLNPPLEEVPEDDWMCPFCTSGSKLPGELQRRRGKHSSARQMLLAGELWAARIEKVWSEQDGSYWFKAGWFLIPEETSTGRQKHTGSRELFRSSQSDVNEMDSILRHCYVMSLDEYKKSAYEGDDVFYCEYEYNERWCRFKRIDYDSHYLANEGSEDEVYNPSDESEEEVNGEEERSRQPKLKKKLKKGKSPKAANKRQSFSGGIEQLGAKIVVERPRKGSQSLFEKAIAALTLSAVPPSMRCRDLERAEIAAFLKHSVTAGEQCLGHCLYISGVPGTGKTATVREVIKDLYSKVDSGELPAFRFVEINGLRVPSPDHVYTVLHEAFTGQHLGWKKALECLDDRFSNPSHLKGSDARPSVLLIDELDVLVNRNQSVLYNVFDWPSRPHSGLIVIGIANTIDFPERLLPRIASRMGIERISFSPYSHKQVEEIIGSRLEGLQIFDKQAAEFASRKVAAVSGDIRRALELCRRAVEVAAGRIAEHKSSSSPENTESLTNQGSEETDAIPRFVTMGDVDSAISQLFEAPQIQMMQRASKLAKIFLTAMVCEQRRTSMVETTFEKVAATCSELCASNGEDIPDFDTLLGVGCKLGALRLLLCEPGARHKLQKLQLNFHCDDVSYALKEDSGVPWLVKHL